MNKRIFFFCLLFWFVQGSAQELINEQLGYERVRNAKEDYDADLASLFESKGLAYPPQEIYLRAFKFDKEMELWARGEDDFVLVKTYDICEVSGELGPKNRRGDNQIPEGAYQLQAFNPVSNFHLSMKVNYPNEADRLRGYTTDLGGDIYIHGDCVTIGCIPIRDEPIKELYWLSVQVKQQGGEIPIHIFPFRMDDASLHFFKQLPLFDQVNWEFWDQLLPVYEYFEKYHRVPVVTVSEVGKYVLSKDDNPVNN